VSEYPTAPYPVQQAPVRQRRRSRGWLYVLIAVVLLLVLLVIADRVSVAYAENKMAQQIQSQGLSSKPHVSIEGFPFLTQVLSRNLHEVNITAPSVSEGPLNINNLVANLQGIHLNSGYNSGTVDHLTGTALITFGDLFGGQGGPSVTVTAVHGNEVTMNVDADIVSGTVVARVTQVGTDKIHVQVISASGIPVSLLPSSFTDFTVTVPNLPLNMNVQSVNVSGQGVLIHVTGSDIKFKQ
jgi:LmeA-like phospholipid-binding